MAISAIIQVLIWKGDSIAYLTKTGQRQLGEGNSKAVRQDPATSMQVNKFSLDNIHIIQHIYMYIPYIRLNMRTTLNIEDALLSRAEKLTGITEKTRLVHLGLKALIARESAKRLARLGGSENALPNIPRRREE